ncbi:MAG TPA: hypothetical protein VIL33_02945, partial [Rhodothermia bacterium]
MRAISAQSSPGARGDKYSEILYNGIVPPDPFPPVRDQPWSTDELPYYITNPPPVIRIDIGRQLFVDDFLIESMPRLTRTYHRPEPFEGNPLFSPSDEDFHIRIDNAGFTIMTKLAMPFSDGVWWDNQALKFRAWYLGGPNSLRLAESSDGVNWARIPAGGVVMSIPRERDSGTVWIDAADPDPGRRYKMSFFSFQDKRNWLYASADGVDWPDYNSPVARSSYYSSNPDAPTGDRTTFLYNPFRRKWVWSLRDLRDRRAYGGIEYHRMRRYWEGDDLFEASAFLEQSGFWIEADVQDLEGAGPPNRPQLTIPQVYNVDGFAYESIMIFGLTILSSNAWEDRIKGEAFDKRNEVYLAFSRDGFYMTRPSGDDRRPFVAIGEPDSWNEGNVQTVGAGCVITGEPESEILRFFYTGRKNDLLEDGALLRQGHLGCGMLRRDGFASIEAGVREGQLTTRPLRFDHADGFLFVNADTGDGNLRVEVLDEGGQVIPGFERDRCLPIQLDSTRHAVRWDEHESLEFLSRETFRLRFLLRSGSLFSFWVSPTRAGASEGYLAAGGPAYQTYVDASPPDTSSIPPERPNGFDAVQISPNPMGALSTVTYYVVHPGHVVVSVHDAAGRTLLTLWDGAQSPGTHTLRFERGDLAA